MAGCCGCGSYKVSEHVPYKAMLDPELVYMQGGWMLAVTVLAFQLPFLWIGKTSCLILLSVGKCGGEVCGYKM